MTFRILLLCALLSSTVLSQTKPTAEFRTDALHAGANEYQILGGYSPDSLTWIGKSEARRLFMAGAGWHRVMLATDGFAWKFTVDLVPVALLSQPTFNGVAIVQDPKRVFAGCTSCSGLIGRRTTYGAGFAPVGFEFNFRRQHRVQPIANINAGLLRFTREVPVANSAAINFTFSWGAGLQIFASKSRSVTIGYRFHHISNANSGTPFNPGIDSNFIYAGYSFYKVAAIGFGRGRHGTTP
jgi:opacity protein-like surface antigen